MGLRPIFIPFSPGTNFRRQIMTSIIGTALKGLTYIINLFTTIHDGNFRRHSSMNATIK